MSKKIVSVIIVLSAIVFTLLLSPVQLESLIFFPLLGGVIGFIADRFCIKRNAFNEYHKSSYLIAIILGIIVCYTNSNVFYNSWEPSSKMQALIGMLFSNYEAGLRIISFILALVALPFTVGIIATVTHGCILVFNSIIHGCRFIFNSINYREVLNTLVGQDTFINRIKGIFCIVAVIIVSALVATILLYTVYLLPVYKIEKNVARSAVTIEEEGAYPVLSELCTSKLDNFTDSIMLLEAADDSNDILLKRIMIMYRGSIEGLDPAQTLVSHYIHGIAFDSVEPYSRYWHGYHIFLKPLLLIMDYNSIRVVNGLMQMLVIAAICFSMIKRKMHVYVIPFLITYGMLMPVALSKALQYSSCFYVFSAGIIALLIIKEEKLDLLGKWLFFYIGIGTAFFDFLTYPISTYGIPIVFYLALSESKSTEKKIGNLIRNGFFWVFGYGGMWFAKWVLASIITGENIIADGTDAVIRRTSNLELDGIQQINLLYCERINFAKFFSTPITILLVIYLMWLIIKLIKKRRNYTRMNIGKKMLPYIIVSFSPVVWYAVSTNHSKIHSWFTNKACAVTVLAVCFALVSLVNETRIQEGLKNYNSQ